MKITRSGSSTEEWSIDYLAKHTGMTTEGVRYYDKTGIIKASRDTGNGRRVYSSEDVFTLMMLQKYRGMGFSVSGAESLMYSNGEDVPGQLSAREKETSREIARLELIRKEINGLISLLSEADKNPEPVFSFSSLKPFYYFSIIDESDSKEKAKRRQKLVKKWNSMKPAAQPVVLFSAGEDGNELEGDTALMINLEDSRYMKPVDEDSYDIVTLQENRQCLVMTGKCVADAVEYVYESYRKAEEFLRKQGRQIDSVFLDLPLLLSKGNDEMTFYKKFIFLIK